jgi:orotate phosphoribosyltransferase
MDFVKEFATFLHSKGAIKFGDFTLASGKKSSYYIDLRVVPSFPHEYRKMIKHLQNQISTKIGFEKFDSLVSVPTGGLVIASSLAFEIVKPLIYVRNKPKDYGTSKSIEGKFQQGMKVLMIDDVATTGGSMINAIKALKQESIVITDAFVIVNRNEGAEDSLKHEGVSMHHLIDVITIAKSLFDQHLISDEVFNKVKDQINSNKI